MEKFFVKFKVEAASFASQKATSGKTLVVADERSIKMIHATGGKPVAEDLFMAIMANQAVRELVKNYQDSGWGFESDRYAVIVDEHFSGSEDFYLQKASFKGGEYLLRKKKYLFHTTMHGKIEEDILEFSMREFIEVMAYYNFDLEDADSLLEVSGTQLLKYKEVDMELKEASKLPL